MLLENSGSIFFKQYLAYKCYQITTFAACQEKK